MSRGKRIWLTIGVLLLVPIIVVRLYLGVWLLNYVNDVLDNIDGYRGSVESIDIDLYRGAYKINKLVLNKEDGGIPTPFVSIQQVDLSLQWSALFHGRIVSSVVLIKPVLNFAVKNTASQTGVETDWTKPIKDLMPVDINIVTFRDGRITYQDFASTPKVDVYIHHMDGEVRNLRNVVEASNIMPTIVNVSGDSIGNGKLQLKGRMNILKVVPDMDLLAQIENVNLVALSNYSDAYASFDFKNGKLSVYSELVVKNKHVSGYIKPIATNVSIGDLHKPHNPIKVVWDSVVAGIVTLFTNHHQDQFATKINLEGNLDNVQTSSWSAFVGVLHNAFIEGLRRGLESTTQSVLPTADKKQMSVPEKQ